MTPKKKKTRRRNIFFYLHCRGYVYSGKLMEDERNDLTLSHANSGFFFIRETLIHEELFLYMMYNLYLLQWISRNK